MKEINKKGTLLKYFGEKLAFEKKKGNTSKK